MQETAREIILKARERNMAIVIDAVCSLLISTMLTR